MTADLLSLIDPIFIAYGALTLMALLPIYFGSFSALEEIKVPTLSVSLILFNFS
jgi:hypothetical protein